jgi:ribose-phosphate pyrophosphokinase
MVITNTVDVPASRRFPALTILSIAELLGNAIQCIHSNESVSQLFEINDEKQNTMGEAAAD